ncbi:cytochrome P450 4C1-like [Zophobas morio]|uniref:cytochrome P450 4C1-like n=1 Tax=Zophobas morio TaxID=2755281 RepID=UPI0030830003
MLLKTIIFSVLFIIIVVLWKKRWLLYHSWKIPGPFAVPLVGSAFLLSATKDNFFDLIYRNLDSWKPVTKFWVGAELYIVTTRPTDVEKILTNCLTKSPFYDNLGGVIKDSLLTLKVSIWKKHRKMINPSFKSTILNSFHDVFVKYSREMVKFLNDAEGNEQSDLVSVIWEKTLDSALATLTNVKPDAIKERRRAITAATKIEEIFIQRFHNFWLLIDFIWKLSKLHEEYKAACQIGHAIAENIITEEHKSYESLKFSGDIIRSEHFLPHLIKLNQTKQITRKEILEEMSLMLIASSETTALTVNIVLTILGIYPDIQEKVFGELVSVLPTIEKDPTLEDISRLDYLKRVVKETMRLVPIIPFILRYTDEDIKCGSYVFPAGSNFFVPIIVLHRDSDVWPEPEKFDPDRFLYDKITKREHCSYIPFSFGSRNCIGLRYAMMSVKVMLATILRSFKVQTVGLKSWKDIQWEYLIMLKPKNIRLLFEKRAF